MIFENKKLEETEKRKKRGKSGFPGCIFFLLSPSFFLSSPP